MQILVLFWGLWAFIAGNKSWSVRGSKEVREPWGQKLQVAGFRDCASTSSHLFPSEAARDLHLPWERWLLQKGTSCATSQA